MLLDDLKQAIMDHNIIEIKYDKDIEKVLKFLRSNKK